MSLYEVNENPFEENKQHILSFIANNTSVFVNDANHYKIKTIADGIMRKGIKQKDATHLACAILAECGYFITTGRRVLKLNPDKIKVVNPIAFDEIWRAL
jgi:predicted nucleic acid-binding protein